MTYCRRILIEKLVKSSSYYIHTSVRILLLKNKNIWTQIQFKFDNQETPKHPLTNANQYTHK